VALVASWVGGWQWSGAVTGTCALAGMLLARVIGGLLSGKQKVRVPDQLVRKVRAKL